MKSRIKIAKEVCLLFTGLTLALPAFAGGEARPLDHGEIQTVLKAVTKQVGDRGVRSCSNGGDFADNSRWSTLLNVSWGTVDTSEAQPIIMIGGHETEDDGDPTKIMEFFFTASRDLKTVTSVAVFTSQLVDINDGNLLVHKTHKGYTLVDLVKCDLL